MPTEPKSAFLLLRSLNDLDRANADLTAYLSVLRSRSPTSDLEALQGIWVDEDGVANLPSELALPDAQGTLQTVRILEATGINGIWMLCWLEAAASTVSRVELVAELLSCFGHADATPRDARFIPVFANGTPDSDISLEVQSLETRYPGITLSPVHQDASGSLMLPSAQPHSEERRT